MLVKLISMPVMVGALGGISLWLPTILLYAYTESDGPTWLTFAIPLGTSLACYVFLKSKSKSHFVGLWMFIGIHMTGTTSLLVATNTIWNGFSEAALEDIGFHVLLSIPPLLWWFSGMCGAFSIFIVAPFLGYQAAREFDGRRKQAGP